MFTVIFLNKRSSDLLQNYKFLFKPFLDDGSIAFYGSSIRQASEETLAKYGLKSGVEIVELGPGKLMEAGAVEGFIIQYVNDQQVKTPQDVIDIVKKSKRAVFVEGITPSGRTGYFGFGV